VAAVIDLFSRRVVGWAFSSRPDADLVIKALDVAYEQRDHPRNVCSTAIKGANMEVAASVSACGVTGSSKV